jgi:hypothetical protein
MTKFNRESNAKTLSEAVNSKTKFIEVNEQRFAYRSIGTGLPIILLNRFRGTLDTWELYPAVLMLILAFICALQIVLDLRDHPHHRIFRFW